MKKEELKRCPFCGSDLIRKTENDEFARCKTCDAFGPDKSTGYTWNDRAADTAWHDIDEPPSYGSVIAIKYESGIKEILYFFGNTWAYVTRNIRASCNEHTGKPVSWCYIPEDSND